MNDAIQLLRSRGHLAFSSLFGAQIAGFQMKWAAPCGTICSGAHPRNMSGLPARAVYAMVRGLPKTGLWPLIRNNVETEMERSLESDRITQQAAQVTGSSVLSHAVFPASPSSPLFPSSSNRATATPNPFASTTTSPFLHEQLFRGGAMPD